MFVYGLVDPRDGQIRYIGETKRPIHKRVVQHRNAAKTKTTPPVNAWLRGLLTSGLEPVVIELDACAAEADMHEAEIYWIEQFRAMGANLLNIAPGGETRVGYRHSEETKAKWRRERRGENAPMYGKRRTAAQKEVFREIGLRLWQERPHPNLGKKRSPETIEKIRAARTGQKMSAEARARMSEAMRRRWAKARGEVNA